MSGPGANTRRRRAGGRSSVPGPALGPGPGRAFKVTLLLTVTRPTSNLNLGVRCAAAPPARDRIRC